MNLEELAVALDGPTTVSGHNSEEILEHFTERYEIAPWMGREIFLFSQNRSFGGSKHIVSIHGRDSDVVPEHIYQYVVFTYCYQGTFEMSVDGARVTLSAGDCIVCDRSVPHSVYETDAETFAVNVILADRFFQKRMMADISRLNAKFPNELATTGLPHIDYRIYRTANDELVREAVNRILCEHLDPQVSSADIIDDYTAVVLTHLFRTFEATTETRRESDKLTELVGMVHEYIGNNYREGNLKRMAADLGYESTYLSATIHKATGRTFKQLVNEERMRHALLLLQSSGMPIADVATAVGVSNLTQFYKRFREFAECTPQEYRKRVEASR